MSPSFWTMAIATRLALPKTFSYSRYTFMYSCFNGTILLKPASTTMREAEAMKSSVSIEKTTSHALRWSKTTREAVWISRSSCMSAPGAGGNGHRPRPALTQHEDGVGRAQDRPRERARAARVERLEGLAVVARDEDGPGCPREHDGAVGQPRAAHECGLRGVVHLLPRLAGVGGTIDP